MDQLDVDNLDHERTVLAALPQAMLVFGFSRGVAPPALCETAGLSLAQLSDRDRFVPHDWYYALWHALREHLPDVQVGIEFGKFMTPDHMGYAGQVFRNARDGLDVLRKMARFGALLDSRASHVPSDFVVSDGKVRVMAPPELVDGMLECAEASMFGLVTQLNALTDTPVRVLELHMHLTDRRNESAYEEFFQCPIHFGSESDGLVFDRESLRTPLRGANLEAAEAIEAYVAESFVAGPNDNLVARLERIIERQLRDGALSQADAARGLKLNVRALQRRLSRDGRSFADIAEGVRRAQAVRMLEETDAAVYEVAFCLGYRDVSSFNRAFKRWLGVSPRSFREKKNQGSR